MGKFIRHVYTKQELDWLKINSQRKDWKNRKELLNEFNKYFGNSVSENSLQNQMWINGIKLRCVQNNNAYTDEQILWIKSNLDIKPWKDIKEFTNTFNAIFDCHKTVDNMYAYLARYGYVVNTTKRRSVHTDEELQWIRDNFDAYKSRTEMAKAYKERFNREVSLAVISKLRSNAGVKSDTRFKTGNPVPCECPIGTIHYDRKGNSYIKVSMHNGDGIRGGTTYSEPYWKLLRKKIWEDAYGEVPKGYCVVSLTGNKDERDINNLAIIDRRCTPTMATFDWWTDNPKFTGAAVQWCNLYITAKDRGVYAKT